MPRERVLMFLWPDSPPPRARSSLNQLLYALRRDLGVADLVLGTTTLRLNRQLVASDVADLESALAEHRYGDAASLYQGPFLEGFSIPELPDLDGWAAAERQRLHQAFLEASRRAEAAAGGLPVATAAPSAATADGPLPAPARRRQRPVLLAGLGTLAIAVAVLGVWRAGTEERTERAPPQRPVAVLPFSYRGVDPDGLMAGVPALLAASLDGAGEFRAIDPEVVARAGPGISANSDPVRAAKALGAVLVVRGEVARTGERVRVVARFGPADSVGQVPATTVEGPADSLFALIDRLAAALIASRVGTPRSRLTRVAATTTASLPALKAYLEGEGAMRSDRHADAVDAFRRAVELDTTFALGYYQLARAAEWAGRDSVSGWAIGRAVEYADRLAEDDQMLVHAAAAWRAGDITAAEARFRAVVDDHPDHVHAWFELGEVLFHGNPLRGRSSTEAAGAFRRVLALDADDAEALVHLARIEALEGRRRSADSLVRRAVALVGDEAIELRAFRAFVLADREAQKQATRALLEAETGIAAPSALAVAVYLDDLEGTERFGAMLANGRQPPRVRALGRRILARTALARGRWRAAFTELRAEPTDDPTPALELRAIGSVLPFLEIPRDTLLAVAAELQDWDPQQETAHSFAHLSRHPEIRHHLLGLVCAALGDSARALRLADELDAMGAPGGVGRTFAASVRAHVSWRAGRHDEVVALIERSRWPAFAGAFEAEALDRYLRADALARTGRDAEALGWFAALGERAAYELVYLAPAAEWQAKLLERAGQTAEAAAHRARARNLWSGRRE